MTASPGMRPNPASGPCGTCGQDRPLWRYRPEHTMHFYMPDSLFCRWCTREIQPLLCAGCYQAEHEREMAEPVGAAEQAAIDLIAGRCPAQNGDDPDALCGDHDADREPVPHVRGQLALDGGGDHA